MRLFVISALLLLSVFSLQAEELKNKALVKGLDHLGLTVKDLDKSADFFVDYLSFTVGGEDKSYPAKFLSNGEIFITLWQSNPDKTVDFNRKQNVGLHHLALKIATYEDLMALYHKIKDVEGVVIEFAPESFYGGASRHMMIREPSGNRLEFIYRAPKKSKN